MFCRTLLPTDARLTPVGGPGKEVWAAGKNWPIQTTGLQPENLALMGKWRVEVTPGTARKDDVFLHVYGKAPRPGRKLGHVTVVAETRDDLEAKIDELAADAAVTGIILQMPVPDGVDAAALGIALLVYGWRRRRDPAPRSPAPVQQQ